MQLQDSQLPDKLRVDEALDLYSSFYRNPADWRSLIDLLGLTGKATTRFGKLSGGQKQRLSIALALVGTPQIAMIDELTTGLDPAARHETWELIEGVRDRGVTIVLVTHFMEEAERLCDRVALIDSGRVVAIDTPANLADGVETEQRIQFRPSVPLPTTDLLESLPDVTTSSTGAMSWWSRATATRSTRSPPCWPATRSWPGSCAWTRPASRTRSSP